MSTRDAEALSTGEVAVTSTTNARTTVTVKPAALTEYVVLRTEPPHDPAVKPTYAVLETVKAVSAEAAIRNACMAAEGTYVAIPTRSWKPVTVKLETTTVIKLEA